MNDNYPSIRGFRVGTDAPKPSRELRMDYLKLSDHAAKALRNLRIKANGTATSGKANCLNKPEEFSDSLPTDDQAELLCAGCDAFKECDIYRIVGKPAHGVYAGKVVGRSLENLEDEDA